MRVTHVITRLIVGGAQENTVATVLGLDSKPNLQVDLISGPTPENASEGSIASEFIQAGGRLTIVPNLIRAVHPLKDLMALRHLTRFFRQHHPRIVHTHSGKAGILGRMAAHRAGIPIIIHTIHGPSFGAFQGLVANGLFRSAERRAGRVTTHFVGVAQAMCLQYLDAGIGSPDQYSCIYSGFNLEPFLTATNDPALRAQWGIGPNDFVIGMIARLFKLKGHDDLLAIARPLLKAHPRLKFLLVGDGSWRTRFDRLVKALGIQDSVVFTGLVPPSDVPKLVGIMDTVVHLSRREGLPRAIPQALAAAKPVVAYDCDGAAEVCVEGQTGFLVRPGDLNRLENCLAALYRDSELRSQFGRTGQNWVRDFFTVEKMNDAISHLYQRLDHAARDKLKRTDY